MSIGVLGPLTAGDDVALSPRDRVVLSALVVRDGAVTSAEELADALWGEHPPASWHKVVPGCVNRIRKALGPEAIVTDRRGYRLQVDDDVVDVRRFERLVGKGNQLLALGEPDRAVLAFREALSLWRGPALREVEEWPPAVAEIERLEELRLETEEAVIDASLRVGLLAGILAEARSRVAQAPTRERRWALLALTQYLSGSQADALGTLRRAREMLSRELGLDPGAELAELEQAVLRQDPSLTAASALPRPVARCPYPGLLPYDVSDADFFFGRSADLAACRERLKEHGVVVLVGPSGSGKSSLLRAGLGAALAEEGKRCTVVPAGASENELLGEICDAEASTVLVLDQLEEIVAGLATTPQRTRFAEALVDCADRRWIALAVRADRFGDLVVLPGIAALAEKGLVLLAPLGEEALREAIEGPARAAALLLEPGMVDVLLHDVQGDPGALPLLSHALRETWERREGRTLTVEGYRASGGIRGAVARSAEEVYEALPEGDRARLRGLMLRLLNLAPDGEPLRSTVPRTAIPEDPAHENLVERLVRARLVTADADVLGLAHETLARAWPRLRGWLDDDREGQRVLRHLSTAAENWDAMGRPDAELYRGDRLARATAWQQASGPDLTVNESEFLARSRQVAQAATDAAERAAAAQRRRRRRGAALVATVAALALVTALAASAAVRERDRAASERARAAADRLTASARRASSMSYLSDDTAESLLLAVESVRRDSSTDTQGALLSALARSPSLIRILPFEAIPVPAADGTKLFLLKSGPVTLDSTTFERANPNRETIRALLAQPGRVLLDFADYPFLENRSGKLREARPPGAVDGELTKAVADTGSRRIAATFQRESRKRDHYESLVAVWEPWRRNGQSLRLVVDGAPDHAGVDDLLLSPPGDRLLLTGRDPGQWLRSYDARTGAVLASVRIPSGPSAGIAGIGGSAVPMSSDLTRAVLARSSDGRWLATNAGSDVAILDPDTLKVTARLRGHTQRVTTVAVSDDDRLVAAGALDGSVLIWDAGSGALLKRFDGDYPVESLFFSSDSTTLYGAAGPRGVLVWDLSGRREFVSSVNDPQGRFGYLPVPAPDGRSAAYFRATTTSLGRDMSVDIVTASGRHRTLPAGFANWGAYSPSGDRLVTVVRRHLQVWDPLSGRLVGEARVAGLQDAVAATYTPDGSWIVVGDRLGSLRAVDATTLTPVGEPISMGFPLSDLIPAERGTRVVALFLGADGLLMPAYAQVDPAAGEVRLGPSEWEARVGFGAVSPDGKRLAMSYPEGRVGLVDLRTGHTLAAPTKAHDLITRVDYSSDGSRFVTSGFDGRVVLWDGRSGERLAEIRPLGPAFATGVSFLPDGHTVSIAGSNGQLLRWDTDVSAWISYACRVAGRNLTEDEWLSAFGSEPYRPTCPGPSTT